MCQVGRLRGTPALGRRLWEPRPTALGQEALTLGLLGQETPPSGSVLWSARESRSS